MRILYIDQYFSTREGNSGTRSYEFARRFAAAGHEVTILTTASGYSNLAGQKPWIKRQRIEGIEVVSFRIGYEQRMGYLRRALSFVLFMVASTIVGLFLRRHDVVFASSTPLSVGVTGAIISWVRGAPFVFEVRDLWPRAPIEFGIIRNPVLKAILTALEGWIYRSATRINALSPGMAEGIVSRGVAAEHVSMIPNACDMDLVPERAVREEARRQYGLPARCFLVVYAGTLGLTNDVGELLRVAKSVQERGGKNIRFLIIGKGSEEDDLRRSAASMGLTNLAFTGGVTRSEASRLIAAADLGVTCFGKLPVLEMNSPNKMFDYLALGLPQMVNKAGWMREVVEGSGAGFYWPHGEPDVAAEKIIDLAKNRKAHAGMRKAALKLANERFERGRLTEQMLSLFEEARSAPAGGWPILWQGLFDRALVLAALAVLSPFLAAMCVAIKREDGGPILYRTRRVGLDVRLFDMLKFRTMVAGAESIGLGLNVAKDDGRITRVGRFLREWSLDEVPQLLNVLKGEMRLVGPRPALPEHTARYAAAQARRLRVRPGLTGWAQVNGRNGLTWTEKLDLDAWYADHRNFALDLRIIARTIRVVARREGLYEKDAGRDDPFNREL